MGNPKKESKIQNKAYFGRYDGFSKVWCKIRESDLCVLTNFQNKMKLISLLFKMTMDLVSGMKTNQGQFRLNIRLECFQEQRQIFYPFYC